ncbi:MAG: ribonuclease P protein component 4 [Candidatus Bathycorpusculaceae bacterium]
MSLTVKQIAIQRIQALFQKAKDTYRLDPHLSQRYVEMARKIAMAAEIRLPTKYKRQTCKNCKAILILGANCRVRTRRRREPHIVITCLACGHQTRIPLKARKEKTKT